MKIAKQHLSRWCFSRFLIISAGALLPCCAQVTFHSDPSLRVKTGLKYFTAKPYLLVSYTGSKDNPIKVDVISLPDLEHPTYVVYHPGWGSHIFSLAVNANGTLTSYGQTADSKGPETIAALGGLLGSVGTAASGIGAAATAFRAESKELDQAKTDVQNAIGELRNIVIMQEDPNRLVAANKQKVDGFVGELQAVLSAMDSGNFDQRDTLSRISDEIEKAKIPEATGNGVAVGINSYYTNAKKDIADAIDAMKAGGHGPAPQPDFKLFEIRMEGGTTKLIPVEPGTARKLVRGVIRFDK